MVEFFDKKKNVIFGTCDILEETKKSGLKHIYKKNTKSKIIWGGP